MEENNKTQVEHPLSDTKMQEYLNEGEIIDYFQTDIYNGRHVNLILKKNGTITIKQTSFQLAREDNSYKPTILNLSPETFSFLLDAMLHAEKEFKIDTKANIKKLTNGKKIEYKKTLSI